MAESSTAFGTDFGQKVDLTASIRNILRNYPEGTAILKELLQNADDAGAKSIKFCLDCRSHGTSSVAGPNLRDYQGPALLVYNDGIFTDEDLRSIQRIGDSLKNAAESQAKIGRFGIGFNAVYHWTDLPSFISSKHLVLLDPQATILPNVNPSNPGKLVDWVTNNSIVSQFRDQFTPYDGFNGFRLDAKQPFKGTLFRLPLRTENQSKTSLLSKRYLSIDDATDVLLSLKQEASEMLLFLKNIEELEISIWKPENTQPKPFFHCKINNITNQLASKRRAMGIKLKDVNCIEISDFTLEIGCVYRDYVTNEALSYAETWELCNQLGARSANDMAFDPNNALLRLVPWAGVAARVRSTLENCPRSEGVAYCFLPLPISTNLPIMLNGFFELSSNRRDVWQGGSDMTGDGKKRAQWNVCLMRDVISPSYIRLLLRLKNMLGWSEYYQSFWPSFANTPAPWNNVAEQVYQLCKNELLLLPLTSKVSTSSSAASNANSAVWIPCRDAVMIPSDLNLSSEEVRVLEKLLIQSKVSVVACQSTLQQSLVTSKATSLIAYPLFIRQQIRSYPITSTQFIPEEIHVILKYCISDIHPLTGTLQDLDLLSLLPTLNQSIGTIRVFSSSQLAAISQIQSMGFSYLMATSTLIATKFNIENACDKLLSEESNPLAVAKNIYFIVDEEEAEMFANASAVLLDNRFITGSIRDFLSISRVLDSCNIRKFEPSCLLDLLRFVLPKSNMLQGIPLKESDIPKEQYALFMKFLEMFWKYVSSRDHLIRCIENGPSLVPTTSGLILKLSVSSMILIPKATTAQLNDSIINALSLIGANIGHSMLWSEISMPKSFWNHVSFPNRRGFLDLMKSILEKYKNLEEKMSLWTPEQRDDIRYFLYISEPSHSLTGQELSIIKQLPIFKLYGEDEKYVKLISSTNLCILVNNQRLSPRFYPESMVYHTGNESEIFMLQKLGVKVLKRSSYYLDFFLSNATKHAAMSLAEYIKNILTMLLEWTLLSEEDKSFMSTLANIEMLPNEQDVSDGMVRKLWQCSELFDPSVEEFKYLVGDDLFPSKDFQREDILVVIRSLGLQTTLQWKNIVACARGIERQAYQSLEVVNSMEVIEKLYLRSKNLLHFLDNNIESLLDIDKKKTTKGSFGLTVFKNFFTGNAKALEDEARQREANIQELLDISWLPIIHEPIVLGMPWYGHITAKSSKICFGSPNMTRSIAAAWYCSSCYYITDITIKSKDLSELFQWHQSFTGAVLAKQLQHISESYAVITSNQSLSKDELISQYLHKLTAIIPQIYEMINVQAKEDGRVIYEILRDLDWIWVGERFVKADKVALISPMNVTPYLYQLPQDMRLFTNLLTLFNIKHSFTSRDYIAVLQDMAMKYGYGDQATIIDEMSCDLAVSLATIISNDGKGSASNHHIYIPDTNSKFQSIHYLVYDDVPWLSGPEHIPIRSTCHFTHMNLASQVALNLGVQSLRALLVRKSAEQNLFSQKTDVGMIESFGQTESLTNRLKGILDLYPDGNPILSELIQNADDSGATKVCIMLDYNSYDTESLLDSSLGPLQGPSLLFHNNSTFTEDDFKALARIGQGSKIEKLATTGRFGLGFSSTYHLTDTPSFVSGEYMVILDPHCNHVPGASLHQPGIRIKYNTGNLSKTFKDQFEPFRYFNCDFERVYQSTLFRFPLRTVQQAKKSEICKRSYSVHDVKNHLNQLAKQLSHHMIFLRNVTEIELYECPDGSRSPLLLHRAQSMVENIDRIGDQSIFSYFQKKEGTKSISRDDFYLKLLAVSEKNLPQITSTIHVDITSYPTAEDRVASVTAGSMAIDEKKQSMSYLLVTGIKGGEARKMACDEKVRHLKLIPLGSVAVCIKKSHYDDIHPSIEHLPVTQGQAFCFLPLPIHSNLPVHLNAYWELSSNRRDIWRGNDMSGESKLRSDWNVLIMEDILAPLYVHLIKELIKLFTNNQSMTSNSQRDELMKKIYQIFPSPIPSNPWDILAKSMLKLINKEKVLWSSIGRYVSIHDAVLFSVSNDGSINTRLHDLLILENIPLVLASETLLESFRSCNLTNNIVSPSFVRSWFNRRNSDLYDPSIMLSATATASTSSPSASALALSESKALFAWQSRWKEKAIENAIFLLQYCCQDINRNSYLSMIDVALLPLENGSITFIGSKEFRPVYIVSETERKLLNKASNSLVVSDEVIGIAVTNILKDPNFTDITNITPMTSNTFFNIIKEILPIKSNSWEGKVVNRMDVLSDQWIKLFWSYIVEAKLLNSIRNDFPLLPIIKPPSYPVGEYCVRVMNQIPILHMSFNESSPNIIDILGKLGIYIIDAKVLDSIAYSQDLLSLLQLPSARGIMNALQQIGENKQSDRIKSWSPQMKDLFREFLLDVVISKMNDLLPQDIAVLRSFPVWKVWNQENHYVSLHSDIKIPPKYISTDLLNESFVYLRNETDRSLLLTIGVQEQTDGAFYSEYLIPRLKSNAIPEKYIDSIAGDILRKLGPLEMDSPGITSMLGSIPFIRSSNGILMPARSLFDPSISDMTKLLPKSTFPSSEIYNSSFLIPLRAIGLQTKLSSDGILIAAKTIHQEVITYSQNPTGMNSLMEILIHRGRCLLEYIDINIESLLMEVDPSSITKLLQTNQNHSMKSNLLLGGEWGQELRSLSWIPVFTDPPNGSNYIGVPWDRVKVHTIPIAAPSQCICLNDIWMASSTCRIAIYDISRDLTRSLLSWDRKISGRNISLQLLHMKENFSMAENKSLLINSYNISIYKVYKALNQAYETETELEVSTWLQMLRDKPIVWIHNNFVETNRISFQSLSSMDMKPFLYTLTGELLEYKSMLRSLGIRDLFAPNDLSELIRQLKNQYQDIPLPFEKISLCIGILNLIVSLLQTDDDKDHPNDSDEMESIDVDGNELDSSNQVVKLKLSDLGVIYLPTESRILLKADSVYVNDAPWLMTVRSRQVHFIYPEVKDSIAFMLGSKSLRDHLFSGSNVICPSIRAVTAILNNQTISSAVLDIIAFADAIGGHSIELFYDEMEYPSNSLMNPTLSCLQGPALSILVDGPILSTETITSALTIQSNSLAAISVLNASSENESKLLCGNKLASAFAVSDLIQIVSGREFWMYDPMGIYLKQSSTSNAPESQAVKQPVGHKCYIFGNDQSASPLPDDQDVISKFPDQFQPFLSFKSSLSSFLSKKQSYPGFLLRMPLRSQVSSLSSNISLRYSFVHMFRSIVPRVKGSIVFGESILECTASHRSIETNDMSLDFQISLLQPYEKRQQRKSLCLDKSWKKSGFSSLFGKSFTPPEVSYSLKLSVMTNLTRNESLRGTQTSVRTATATAAANNDMDNNDEASCHIVQETELWVLWSVFGHGRTRSDALTESLASLNMLPLVTIACSYSTTNQIILSSPSPGYLYHGSSSIMLTGLPFHIEGSFLKIRRENVVPMGIQSAFHNISNAVSQVLPSNRTVLDLDTCKLWNTSLLLTSMEYLFPKALIDIKTKLMNDYRDSRASSANSSIALDYLYRYWPYLPRMAPSIQDIAVSCRLYPSLTELPLFLIRKEFKTFNSCIYFAEDYQKELKAYFEQSLHLSQAPVQLSIDMKAVSSILTTQLSPTIVREYLKKNVLGQKDYMNHHPSIFFPLFKYCISDILSMAIGGDYNKSRMFKMLQNCPLMLMADGSIQSFPNNSRDRVLKAPIIFHALLPDLIASLLHPVFIRECSLFQDALFCDSLYVSSVTTSVLQDLMPMILPEAFKRCQAIEWTKHRAYPHYEKLVYVIWKEILIKESSMAEYDTLRLYPIIPILSKGRRLLVSIDFFAYLFVFQSNDNQSVIREALNQEIEELQQTQTEKYNQSISSASLSYLSDIDRPLWMSQSCEESIDRMDIKADPTMAQVAATGANSLNAAAINGSVAIENISLQEIDETHPLNAVTSQQSIPQTSIPSQGVSVYTSPSLLPLIDKLGLPILDSAIFYDIPQLLRSSDLHTGRRLLNSLHLAITRSIIVHDGDSLDCHSMLIDPESLSIEERKQILLEIFKSHRDREFNQSEKEKLKMLPLFTTIDQQYVSVASFTSSFYCGDQRVLQMMNSNVNQSSSVRISTTAIPIPSNRGQAPSLAPSIAITAASASAPGPAVGPDQSTVILVDDFQLREVYDLLGIEELTAFKSANKFLIPVLQRLKGEQLTKKMLELATLWGTYGQDETFKGLLKDIAFIPLWNKETGELDYNRNRKASEVLSWLNTELMGVLMSRDYEKYYSPPIIQQAEYFAMFNDLGMMNDVTKTMLISLFTDIQLAWTQYQSFPSQNHDPILCDEICNRSRRLFRYLNDNDRFLSLLMDPTITSKLKSIICVPVQAPIKIESGGHVIFQQTMARFQDVTTKSTGILSFTILPILSDDICPPHMFLSQLGVKINPSISIVLDHIQNLTGSNESLDRWNVDSLYTIQHTFSAIFSYLSDHWKELDPSKRDKLKSFALIPIANILIKPERLFFKLPLDLSPFLHEVPLSFGSHEQLLKRLGVRTSPVAMDYIDFLNDLAKECHNQPLNTNELRAVKAIIEAIVNNENTSIDVISGVSAAQGGANASHGGASTLLATPSGGNPMTSSIFLPDEMSVLRPSNRLVFNDNFWLREQISSMLLDYDYHFLHPSIALSIVNQLQLFKLSDIVQQKLLTQDISSLISQDEGMSQYKHDLMHRIHRMDIIHALTSLIMQQVSTSTENYHFASILPSKAVDSSNIGVQMIKTILDSVRIEIVADIPSALVFETGQGVSPVAMASTTASANAAVNVGRSMNRSNRSDASSLNISMQYRALSYVYRDHDLSTILINASLIQPPISMEMAAAMGLCDILGLHKSYISVITMILMTSQGQGESLLSSIQLGSDAISMREKLRGLPGEMLTDIDLSMIQLKPFKTYQIGEIVAINSNSFQASKNAAIASGGTAAKTDSMASISATPTNSSGKDENRMKLCYGKIIGIGESTEAGLRRLNIKINDKLQQIFLSSDIYSFRSARDRTNDSQSHPSQGSNNTSKKSNNLLSKLLKSPSKAIAASTSNASEKPLSQDRNKGVDESVNSSFDVTNRDIIDALEGLLTRAGIPIDMEKREMASKLLDLESTNDALKRQIMEERKNYMETKSQLDTANEAMQCSICVAKKVDYVLDPCGHTLCGDCVRRVNSCPLCRKNIRNRIHFFLSTSNVSDQDDEANL